MTTQDHRDTNQARTDRALIRLSLLARELDVYHRYGELDDRDTLDLEQAVARIELITRRWREAP